MHIRGYYFNLCKFKESCDLIKCGKFGSARYSNKHYVLIINVTTRKGQREIMRLGATFIVLGICHGHEHVQ